MDILDVRVGQRVRVIGDCQATRETFGWWEKRMDGLVGRSPVKVVDVGAISVQVEEEDGDCWVFRAEDLELVPTPLSQEDTEALQAARQSNPWWYRIVVQAAKVQADRKTKYTGKGDPFDNFRIVTAIMRACPKFADLWTVDDTFLVLQALKMARQMVNAGDFADERMADTLLDHGNYAFLQGGWRLQEAERAHTAEEGTDA